MKTFVKVLFAFVLLIAVFWGYIAWGPGLMVSVESADRMRATERADAFQTIIEGVKRGDFGENQYAEPSTMNPADYDFITITLNVKNFYPLSAEWALLNLTPKAGDIVLIQSEPHDIGPFGGARVTASLLTKADSESAARAVWLDFYLFGVKMRAIAN